MGIQELQRFIEVHVPSACVPVDLLKIARGVTLSRPRTPASRHVPPPQVELCLVLDAEGCLDRLYGGYFSDWVCGGQWNRMVQFLATLIQTVQANNMELAVFFSGALELPRMQEWVLQQYEQRRDINQALKHAGMKGTPPPKVWWTAPSCLRTALRMALRHLKVQVLQSVDQHRQEVMLFCREHNYHGVMAEDAEYIMLNPPRLFSAKQMKLTYKGSLETKEFMLNELARGLDLQPGRFSLLAALLGNYILTEEELTEFHGRLGLEKGGNQLSQEDLTQLLVDYVRALPSVEDLEEVGLDVFCAAGDARIAKLKRSVQYFMNGTSGDALKLYNKPATAASPASKSGGASTYASDGEPDSRRLYERLTSADDEVEGAEPVNGLTEQLERLTTDDGPAPGSYNNGRTESPPIQSLMATPVEGPHVNLTPPMLPTVPAEVMRTALERHQKGLMSPMVYQVISQGEVKIPVCLEDELCRELPNSSLFYRPARERIYAVLFNLYHHSFLANRDKDKPAEQAHKMPHVQVREWAYSRANPYTRADLVTAQPLGWGVPTVQRLWFGNAEDDKRRRLRALLTCVSSDTPYIRNPIYVPQHLLVLACVLRYIMAQSASIGQPFLRKPELDAFIAQALSPKLTDSQYLQDLQLPSVSARGVQLANLFMQGVDTVLFANDACGAPVPWLMCCPWLFFDGKLFHSYLLKATQCRSALELCDGQPEMASQLDMLREAVLEGLHVQYARPHQLPPAFQHPAGGHQFGGCAANHPSGFSDRRGLGRGGRLEIGGVVVGSWAGNMGLGRGAGRGLGGAPLMRTTGGRGMPPRPTYWQGSGHPISAYGSNYGSKGRKVPPATRAAMEQFKKKPTPAKTGENGESSGGGGDPGLETILAQTAQ